MAQERFIGDAHFGHPKVAIDQRGFATVADHDDTICHNVAKVADEHTRNHWLGDVALGGWRDHIGRISEIPGHHFLWLGNHDRGFPGNRNAHSHLHEYSDVFEGVAQNGSIAWNGIMLLISHLPYDGDHTESSRFDQWRLRDLGNTLIHAHEHGTHRISFSANGTMQIHAGLDAWNLKPPTLHDLMVEAGFALPPMEGMTQ